MAARLFPPGVPRSKRIFDLVLTVPGLIVISPLLVLIGAVAWRAQGRPIIFRQQRPGIWAELFTVYKFRTMSSATGKDGAPLSDAVRLTAFGRFLRSSSLDELPELWNVVRGEMSLVGPRPLLIRYLDRYTPEQGRRHEVLPGITGWTQINGRNAITWEQKFRFDVWYVDNWSLGLDLKILLITFWKVLKREGITQPGQATAAEFMGVKGTGARKSGEGEGG